MSDTSSRHSSPARASPARSSLSRSSPARASPSRASLPRASLPNASGKLMVGTEYEDKKQFFCKCKLQVIFFITCLIALFISVYTMYVKHNMKMMPNQYQPFCDISEKISCSKVFNSKYGKGFGLLAPIVGEDSLFNMENGFLGIIYYIILGMLSLSNSTQVAKYLIYICGVSNLMSLYLGYLLYFVLDDLCIVCVAIYAINLLQLFLAYDRYHKCVEDDNIRRSNENLKRLEKRMQSTSKSPESKKSD